MALIDFGDVADQAGMIGDLRVPSDLHNERRTLAANTVYQFSASLSPGKAFCAVSIGATSFFTLDGTDPTTGSVSGTGNIGLPLLDSQYFYFAPESGMSGSFKAVSDGTPVIQIWSLGEGSGRTTAK